MYFRSTDINSAMFKISTLKIAAYVCVVGSILLFIAALYRALDSSDLKYYLPLFSLSMLVVASSWALNIVNNHQHTERLQDVGWQIYFILCLLLIFGLADLTVAIIPVVFLVSSLYSKNRYVVNSIKAEEK